MHKIVHHIDAFSSVPGKGNPAGVVVETERLDDDAMQSIAKAVGFNECVFVFPSERADFRFRFFTPGHEMPLCGHATVAAASFLGAQAGESRTFTIETRAGVLPVSYDAATHFVTMRHAEPEFRTFAGDRGALARVLGVGADCFLPDLPIVYGSTGTWTLLVPVAEKRVMLAMKPETAAFPGVLAEMPRVSIHPFVIADHAEGMDFVARHFSSPYSGTVEDPVTGTASGVMGAYAMQHMHPDADEMRFVVAQGESVNRDGRVHVHVARRNGGMEVSISGAAAQVGVLPITY